MKKPVQRATPESDTDPIVIKNPFLVAKLEKAAQRMGWSMNQVIVFFVSVGFDKPNAHKQGEEELTGVNSSKLKGNETKGSERSSS